MVHQYLFKLFTSCRNTLLGKIKVTPFYTSPALNLHPPVIKAVGLFLVVHFKNN